LNNLTVSHYKAVISGYRNFPDITITAQKVSKDDNFREDIVYTAESDYGIWAPRNPIAPYRHTGYGKTVEEAVSKALSTFDEDNPSFPNDQVFITKATENYKDATFIDGNGQQVTYDEAKKIVSEAYEKRLNQNS